MQIEYMVEKRKKKNCKQMNKQTNEHIHATQHGCFNAACCWAGMVSSPKCSPTIHSSKWNVQNKHKSRTIKSHFARYWKIGWAQAHAHTRCSVQNNANVLTIFCFILFLLLLWLRYGQESGDRGVRIVSFLQRRTSFELGRRWLAGRFVQI